MNSSDPIEQASRDNSPKEFTDDQAVEACLTTSDILTIETIDSSSDKNVRTSGVWLVCMNISNVIVGSGIIALPLSFTQGGVGASIILLTLSGIFCDFTMMALAKLSDLTNKYTYPETLESSLGKAGFIIIAITQTIYPIFSVLTHGIGISDNITNICFTLAPHIKILQNRPLVLFFPMYFIIFPLTMFRNIAFLDKMSTVSMFCVMFYFICTVARAFYYSEKLFNFPGLFEFTRPGIMQSLSVSAFALACQQNISPIYKSLKNRTVHRFAIASHSAALISTLLYNGMALIGFMTFSGDVNGNLMQDYCPEDKVMIAARVFFTVTLMFTAPLQLFSSRQAITTVIYKKWKFNWYTHSIVTFLLVTLCYSISSNVQDLGFVVTFAGAIIASPFVYILPTVAIMRKMGLGWLPNSAYKIACYVTIIFGTLIWIVGVVMTILFYTSSLNRPRYWCDSSVINTSTVINQSDLQQLIVTSFNAL